jgi:hypothetical protein
MASVDVSVAQASTTALPRKRVRPGELAVQAVLFTAAHLVLTTVGIVPSLLLPAPEFFGEVSPVDFHRNLPPLPMRTSAFAARRAR